MFRHKVCAATHLAWLLLSANFLRVLCSIRHGPRAFIRESRRSAVRLFLGVHAGLHLRGKVRVARVVRMCLASGVSRGTLEGNLEAAVALAERDVGRQRFRLAVSTVTPHIDSRPQHPRTAKCLAVRSLAHLWHGDHAAAVADIGQCARLRLDFARGFNYLANLAQVHGIRGETEEARRAMALQCGAPDGVDPGRFLTSYLRARLAPHLAGIPRGESVGVMFGAYHNALGHAILDPFHFYNLFRHRFDHLVVVHPSLAQYSRATRLMVDVMRQYVETLEVGAGDLAPFAWQNLGELRSGDVSFLCYNYWALNRLAFQARTDPSHPMSRARRYVALPPKIVDRAEAICRKLRLDTARPLVVLHIRSHGYHRLKVQGFRNADVDNYIPCVRKLIDRGYAVVRIGDPQMRGLGAEVPGLVELPLLSGYDNVLDAYFLSRCRFMISCQSGPCSLARAMGKPTLVANAVYHHTMLPESNELFLFKQYRDAGGHALDLEQILSRGAHIFDKVSHFEAAGIEVSDATAEELLAATEEMLPVLDAPRRPDTAAQAAFRSLMRRYARPGSHSSPHATRLTDYVGYALPEGRVSDSMCRLRRGYLPAAPKPARVA